MNDILGDEDLTFAVSRGGSVTRPFAINLKIEPRV
jgi:hypothetical protein